MVVEFADVGVGSFHINRGRAFEGFELRMDTLFTRCACGETLDVEHAASDRCPERDGGAACPRFRGSGAVVDHAALAWRLPTISDI